MRRLLLLGLAGFVLFLIGACAKAAPAPTPVVKEVIKEKEVVKEVPKEVIRWKWVVTSLLEPETELIIKEFAKRVEQRTDGRMKFDILSLPQVGMTGFEMIKVLKGGILDMGEVLPVYVGGDLPILEGFDLPGIYPNLDAVQKGSEAWLKQTTETLEKATNAKRFFWWNWPPQLICGKKLIQKPADFKGLKIRTYSLGLADMFKGLGAEPVSIPYAEAYTALERGIVSAIFTGVAACNSIKVWEIAKYAHTAKGRAGFLNPLAIQMVSNKSWEALPADIKQIFIEESDKIQKYIGESRFERWEKAYKVLQDKGMEIIEVSPEVEAAVTQSVRDHVVTGWAKRVGPEGKEAFNRILGPIVGFTIP